MPEISNPEGGYGAADGNLRITNMHLSDVTPQLVDWLNDAQVVRYLTAGKQTWTRESARDWLMTQWKKGRNVFAVRVDGAMIGTLTVTVVVPDEKAKKTEERYADIGIMVGDKSQWGKGYGMRAIKLACWWAFKMLQLRYILAGVLSDNSRSRAAFEKAGFTLQGVTKGVAMYRLEDENG